MLSKNLEMDDSSLPRIVRRISLLLIFFEKISFLHILRHLNGAIDGLSNQGAESMAGAMQINETRIGHTPNS